MRRHRCAGIGARADVGQQLKVEYYEIRGTSWPDLKRQIDAKGPEGWWGVSNSVTHYAVKPRLTEAGCVAEQVLVEADARVLLPDWADRYAGPRKLQLQWDNVRCAPRCGAATRRSARR